MTLKLQIILAVALIIVFILLINQVRKEKLDLKYALPWMSLLVLLLIIDAFPGITEWLAGVMGIALPINMLMLLGLGLTIVIIFMLTTMLSKEVEKQKQLIQEVGLLKKQVEDLAQKLEDKSTEEKVHE